MAYRPQARFSAGELDPALFEETDLDKFRTGLAVLRNAYIGKTGRIISRTGTQFAFAPNTPNAQCVIYSPPYSSFIVEVNQTNLRLHNTITGAFQDAGLSMTAAQLASIHFVPAGAGFLYLFISGQPVNKLSYGNIQPFGFINSINIFFLPGIPANGGSPSTTATGQPVDYAFSFVTNGQESDYLEILNNTGGFLEPLNSGEYNRTNVSAISELPATITSMKVYRRPSAGSTSTANGAYGFVTEMAWPSGATGVTYTDYNGPTVPDYSHSPPQSIPIVQPNLPHTNPIISVRSKTGAVYQQRLLVSDDANTEAIYGSRTGLQNSMFAETTLTPDSAIQFKAGTSGSANVLRIMDSLLGLLVFTTNGIYQNSGALDYTNLSLAKKGTSVIQENVPPIDLPGGAAIFVDKATNSIRSLIYSYLEQAFPCEEISIFSNHLFQNKKVISWAYQEGDTPLVWMVMDDGTLVSLTYQRENQMQAWARHDTQGGLFESVTVLKDINNESIVYFSVNRGGTRSIETLAPRYYNSRLQQFSLDLKQYVGMDAAVTFNQDIGAAAGGATFIVSPTNINDWTQNLVVTSNFAAFSNALGQGAAGDVFRTFNQFGSTVDLIVVQFVSATQIIVAPSCQYPSDQLTPTIYSTYSVLTGLSQFEGINVSILSDGYVVASPNNDDQNYPTCTVVNGQVTLPNGLLGAFIHVGIPMTVDIQTLDLDTVEEKPTKLESKIVQKVWIKVFNSLAMYVGSLLPDNNSLYEMINPFVRIQDPLTKNIGNAAQAPQTKMYDFAIPNDWKSNGRISIRQVDPLPLEILSITPDLSVLV